MYMAVPQTYEQTKVNTVMLHKLSFLINFHSNYRMAIQFSYTTKFQKADKLLAIEYSKDVGQGISVGPGRFGKKNKLRAWKIWKKE